MNGTNQNSKSKHVAGAKRGKHVTGAKRGKTCNQWEAQENNHSWSWISFSRYLVGWKKNRVCSSGYCTLLYIYFLRGMYVCVRTEMLNLFISQFPDLCSNVAMLSQTLFITGGQVSLSVLCSLLDHNPPRTIETVTIPPTGHHRFR